MAVLLPRRPQPLVLDVVPWDTIGRGGKDGEETQFVMEDVEESTEWRVACLEDWIEKHHRAAFTVRVNDDVGNLVIGVDGMAERYMAAAWIAEHFTTLMDELGQPFIVL